MKNIVDLTIEAINKKNGKVTTLEIVELIDNPSLLKIKGTKKLEAIVYNDLMSDGRFLQVEDSWDLKEKFTIKEILREQYRSLSNIDISNMAEEEEEEFNEEIEMAVSFDDNEYNDDAVAVNNIEEYEMSNND